MRVRGNGKIAVKSLMAASRAMARREMPIEVVGSDTAKVWYWLASGRHVPSFHPNSTKF